MEGGRGHGRPVASALCASLVVGMLATGAFGCGGSGGGDSSTATHGITAITESTVAAKRRSIAIAAAAAEKCKDVKPAKVERPSYEAPAQVVEKGEKLTAVVKTSCGTFDIALNTKWSPTAVNSFVFLAEKGFYDGLGFEHAAFDTYVEGGKPPGAGGPGYSVRGEIPESFIYRHGVVAMMHSKGPLGQAGSIFFVVVASPWLDFTTEHAPIGRISRGIGVAERISELGPPDEYPGGNIGSVGEVGKLKQPVVIERITIERT
jgi:peptidyl-prolyl cis-trans isomerase B (cyclophilin B)